MIESYILIISETYNLKVNIFIKADMLTNFMYNYIIEWKLGV